MNIFNIILGLVRNSFTVIGKLFNTITTFIPKIFEAMISFGDFIIDLVANGIASIIEFISSIINFFGG